MRIICELDGKSCLLPNYISKFMVNAPIMYCNVIDSHGNPQIQPIIFINEPSKCSLAFLVKKGAAFVENMKRNTKIAFTTDKTHPTDPSWNTGIMIEAISHQVYSEKDIKECFDNLQNKYGIDVVSKILGIDVTLSYMKIKAFPLKIIFWKGPFFKRFRCKQR